MADNSSRKFKFISPGVFINEIDQSQLPQQPGAVGPLVIGRARKGPGDKPVTVESFSDFVQTFGNPVPGAQGTDVWREGNLTAPTYAAYAAQAWLQNGTPLTFIRVLGDESTNATTAGKAGWEVSEVSTAGDVAGDDAGGVYALCIWPSGSNDATEVLSGSVAAQIYMNSGRALLSGATPGFPSVTQQGGSRILELTSLDDITLVFTSSAGSINEKVTVSLRRDQENFIRKALNTNPTITNSAITETSTQAFYQGGLYWLGETFEDSLVASGPASIGVLAGGSTAKYYAAMLPMGEQTVGSKASTKQQNNFRGAATRASTGWFISQDLSSNNAAYQSKAMQKLFRLEALSAGESTQREVKISISNIKAPEGNFQDFGSFSVLVRDLQDTDNRPVILERFDGLTLNPASDSYIAKRIGDRYCTYNQSEQRIVEYGEYPNKSNFVRVVMNDTVAAGGGERRWLPFGVFGPQKYRDVGYLSGSSGFSSNLNTPGAAVRGDTLTMLFGDGASNIGSIGHSSGSTDIMNVPIEGGYSGQAWKGIINFPSVPLRGQSSWGSPKSLKNTFWGAWTGRAADDTFFSQQIHDCLRVRSADVSSFGEAANPADTSLDVEGDTPAQATTTSVNIAWVFSLDDITPSVSGVVSYVSGSRNSGASISAQAGASYKNVLSAGADRFTTLLHGGFDGYDISEREPFANKNFGASEETSYELFSLRKAINIAADKDYVQMNVVTIPGVWKATVTDSLLDAAEDRGDVLALVDIQYGYTPDTESTGDAATRNASNTPTQAADTLADRSINNSYGATYYPWVRILDTNTNQNLWVPPTVPALGVLSSTDRLNAPWFAPAGFTRGGLSEGAAGVPVLDVSRRLTSDDRDKLYENNINPIAKFPAEGIVIFGQKTLQQTASALDRINVRRLMIFLKREISFIASRLLFGPNAKDTWDRFLGQAGPLLESVRAEFGIDDFRLVLDETTTTPDLIDRNIIYAKLLVKPTRSVEYFAIDFVVTNSGAAFED